MQAVLDVEDVSKQFLGVRALDGVSLALRAGRVHGLVGENGAGKSTLIKVLTGVYRPDAGALRVGGSPVTFAGPADAQRAGISTIHQEVNLVALMSVARNIYLGREPRNRLGLIDGGALNEAADALLKRYGVEADVRRPLGGYGLGTQQMVALARAMSFDARVVVMDEPTSSLEPREVATLIGVVDQLKADGVAVCYVSHRFDELYALCDRVTVLRDGRVVACRPLEGLRRIDLILLDARSRRPTSWKTGRGRSPAYGRPRPPPFPLLQVDRTVAAGGRPDGVTLHVLRRRGRRPGRSVGSGRTETARAVVFGWLDRPDAGEVLFRGPAAAAGGPAPGDRPPGSPCSPEEHKTEGFSPTCRSATT